MKHLHRPFMLSLIIALVGLLAFQPQLVAGQDGPLTVEEDPVTIDADVEGGLFQATMVLTSTQAVTVTAIPKDLEPVQEGPPNILGSNIEITPVGSVSTLEANIPAAWTVKVSNISTAGEWSGQFILHWVHSEDDETTTSGTLNVDIMVIAHAKPTVALTADEVGIQGVRGTPASQNSRSVTIRETSGSADYVITNIEKGDFVSTDTYGDAMKDYATIPPDNIVITLLPLNELDVISAGQSNGLDAISAGQSRELKIGIDLQGVRAGSYSGKLFFSAQNADDLTIPITLHVKDRVLIAIAVLLGTALGATLGARIIVHKGIKTRHEFRKAQIRELLDNSKAPQAFQDEANKFIEKADDAFESARLRLLDDFSAAQAHLGNALSIAMRWKDHKDNFYETSIERLRTYKEDVEKIDDKYANITSPIIQEIDKILTNRMGLLLYSTSIMTGDIEKLVLS